MKNKQALIKVAEWLEAGAKHVVVGGHSIGEFNMAEAVSTVDVDVCGTACCIAGAIVQFEDLINPVLKGSRDFFDSNYGTDQAASGDGIGSLAANHLGMHQDDAEKLFLPWDHFESDDTHEFSDPSRAAEVVRHYLATGVVDWDMFPPSQEFCEQDD